MSENIKKILDELYKIRATYQQFLSRWGDLSLDETLEGVEIFDKTIHNKLVSFSDRYLNDFIRFISSNVEYFEKQEFNYYVYSNLIRINRSIVYLNNEVNREGVLVLDRFSDEIRFLFDNIVLSFYGVSNSNKILIEGINGENLRRDKIFNECFEKIDVLIFIESNLFDLDFKLNYEQYANANNYKNYLEEILSYLNNNNVITRILIKELRFLKDLKEKISIATLDNLNENVKLIEALFDLKEFLKKINISTEDYAFKDDIYLVALKFYDLQKKSIYKEYEIKDLKNKLNGISFIDKEITDKNEFFNKKIESLLKIEDGFLRLLNEFENYREDDFKTKEWEDLLKVKENIKYIVSVFQDRNTYKYFLLLSDEEVKLLIDFFKYQTVNGDDVDILDERSFKFINEFHAKAANPNSLINGAMYSWNTPLFNFNFNHYTLLKDYKIKEKNIEQSDRSINAAIDRNGEFSLEIANYIADFKKKKIEFDDLVSNLFISRQLTEVAVKKVKENEKYINEIESLYINNETRKIYEGVFKSEAKVANRFRNVALTIYTILGLFAFFSLIILIIGDPDSEFLKRISNPQTLFVKIPLILTLLFIGVYLSREGEKHRRFANQARQTMNELHAFSSYSTDIKEKVSEIKTKLADKYFGVNLYETEKAMTPDSDVFKTLIEQTKVTTDLVKTLQGSLGKSSNVEAEDKKEQSK
jgi:hypothetical protein